MVDSPGIKPLSQLSKAVRIDAGITSLIATSDGEKMVNPKHFNRKYKRLRQAQKTLSRRVKGSQNREKARLEVARIQASISDARKDFLHKLTTQQNCLSKGLHRFYMVSHIDASLNLWGCSQS
ncbi:MAG: transposase [Chroococcidiopsidaceae cyanobacterium CP_BM_ER_R8_30]|nr:transposase [Chroococcidiopsidaceae cyanobacterium CP_BM_ER_R8_30]